MAVGFIAFARSLRPIIFTEFIFRSRALCASVCWLFASTAPAKRISLQLLLPRTVDAVVAEEPFMIKLPFSAAKNTNESLSKCPAHKFGVPVQIGESEKVYLHDAVHVIYCRMACISGATMQLSDGLCERTSACLARRSDLLRLPPSSTRWRQRYFGMHPHCLLCITID